MTSREDVERLRAANARITAMARADLERFIRPLLRQSGVDIAAELMGFVPQLVREYGDLAAAVAAEWYTELRSRHPGLPDYNPVLAEAKPAGAVQGSVGYAATAEGDDMMARLIAAVIRHISYSARETIRRNAERDPARPRYARVPTGARTCAFCEMLASRGFVYHTKATAGEGRDFHDDCDCQVVVEFDKDRHHIAGYDPDAMFARYARARAAAGSSDPSAVTAAMRRLYPDQYTDGVVEP